MVGNFTVHERVEEMIGRLFLDSGSEGLQVGGGAWIGCIDTSANKSMYSTTLMLSPSLLYNFLSNCVTQQLIIS